MRRAIQNDEQPNNVSVSLIQDQETRIVSIHLSKVEKDKISYEEHGVISVLHGMEVEDLLLYGWGFTNKSQVKLISHADSYGNDCKNPDGR